ncbi:ABC transporter G family member 31 [Phytophthora cinnamomi]|uniref:ABC transporter G family member 31 n=1 Tax=Phytophthora cinnamomi TaxID=4785 RepID=UPI00355A2659|nr:ABC transporter G family member 31 [Phytophthora cinnamomi]
MRLEDPESGQSTATTEAQVFYESVAGKLEEAFGRSQPHLEMRFLDLSVSCKAAAVKSQRGDQGSPELPSLWNTLKHVAVNLVSSRKMEQRVILNGVSGMLRPGTMTLVLGQPGSGKSTLLKALSGRLGDHVRLAGDITYNGVPQHLVAKKLPQLAAYVPQNDLHFPLLSVKETLSFAHAFSADNGNDVQRHATVLLGQDVGHSSQQALKSAIDMFENYPEVIKRQLGLQNCWDTIVGGGMVRGVSGGEKKRVTTGEMVLGMQRAVFMDEVSTGLDSAATFDIVHTQRSIARSLGKTMVISLLQPSPDVFALFDDIILLNEGERSANFFQTSAYVLANVISQVPVALPESFIFGAFLYWIGGLEASAGRFIVYEIVVFLIVMAAVLIFFFVAAISPNIYVTNPLALGILQVILVFAGFIVTRDQIPDYLIWLYWLNPMAWGFRALAVNQYRSPTFDVCTYEDVDYCAQFGKTMGEYYLSVYSIPSQKEWVVLGIVYLIGLILVFTALSYLALEYKRYEGDFRVIRSAVTSDEDADHYQLATTPKESSRSTPSASSGRAVSIEIPGFPNAFVPVTVAFKDLWYSVPNPSNPTESIDLLKGISGVARPGTITALMGSSGAGKTTLLDVIAGRKNTGSIRGTIMLNGHEATELAIRRCTGYCEQTDIHSETATFREALTFSAFLRQDSDVPARTKLDSVNEIVNLLGLENVADHMVRGSSLEQLKRLTIGVELAAQPSVLFLDEPTSGLDARFAKMIMDGIRKVANSGRTIICTIHQPSYEVFSVFDNLLLLKRGGETVYYGELGEACQTLVDYFEGIPGVQPLPENYNPATWMLECIGAGVNNRVSEGDDKDFVQRFNKSTLKSHLDATLEEDGVGRSSPHAPVLTFRRKRAASTVVQLKFLLHRFFYMYWRSPAHSLTILGVALGSLIVLGLVGMGLSTTSFQGVASGLGIIFVAFQFQGFVSFNSSIPFAFNDRAAFYRERSAQTYSSLSYFTAGTFVEIPYVFTKGLIISALLFLFMGFTGFGKFLLFWLALSLSILVDVYSGHLLAFLLPNIVMASLAGSVVSTVFFLFVGFNPQGSSISAGYQWLYTITPQRYAMSILATLTYGECSTSPQLDASTGDYTNVGPEIGCQPLQDAPLTVGNATVKGLLEDAYNMQRDDVGRNFGALLVFAVVFRVLALAALQFLNHQKR